MVFSQLLSGGFGKATIVLGAIGFLWMFFAIVVDAGDSALYFVETGDYRPFLEATIGKFIGFDHSIVMNIERLKQPGIEQKYAGYLKTEIARTALILLVMVSFIYWVLDKIAKFFISEATMNVGIKFLMILITLLILVSASLIYSVIISDTITLPGKGLYAIAVNHEVVFSSVGQYINPLNPIDIPLSASVEANSTSLNINSSLIKDVDIFIG